MFEEKSIVALLLLKFLWVKQEDDALDRFVIVLICNLFAFLLRHH